MAHEATSVAAREATVTILFTDIVGSTDLVEKLGDRKARAVLGAHDEIVCRETRGHDGTEVKSMGDGFMLTFRSVHRGMACAVAIQAGLDERNKQCSQGLLTVRMGLSAGEPIHDNDDLFGKSVITAARIAEQARGGQVLVSEIAYALVVSSGEFELGPAGHFPLKDMPRTQPLYEVLWRHGQ